MKTITIAQSQPRILYPRETPCPPEQAPRDRAAKSKPRAEPAVSRVLPSDEGLVGIGRWLQAQRTYSFTTVTPETHRRVLARDGGFREAQNLRDIFGWSLPFSESMLPRAVIEGLDLAGALDREGALLRSRVRYSTLDDFLLMHSAYPTSDSDAVFFGPDTYRYGTLIKQALASVPFRPVRRLVDVGAGSGAGGLVAACALWQSELEVALTDINPLALRYAAVNCELAGISATHLLGDVLQPLEWSPDLVIANPPYMTDPAARTYRDGGGAHGCDLSLRIVRESLQRLTAGGRLILYTGAPAVNGEDVFFKAVQPLLCEFQVSYEYRELDPDVFGEELEQPAYANVERIAAVGLIAQKS